MGEYYDVGLQVGKKLGKEVDDLIKKLHKSDEYGENMNPINRKELDNSIVYRWNMKWEPYWFKDEIQLVEILKKYDTTSDEDYAYKLIAVGDEGGQDEMGNEIGYDIFDGLYNDCSVTFPCRWEETPTRYPFLSFRSIDEEGDYQNWTYRTRESLVLWESFDKAPKLTDPVMDIMMYENMIFPNDTKDDYDFHDLLITMGVMMPDWAGAGD